ncbi:RNA polymerase sigma factor RpoH [Bradyrhizobium sp. NBAIM20]|uniref:RNA polymerase sigma factor RpoH n=1 Tax=unclassified Bradyrhizobium TaxID=2631580 RepID=UPI001CD2AF26|nr:MULTISPECIES: RNA polymerase sigma factor RpoH [unclassified Bradyrhizobium]MCA1410894.1 RNA polymerase sigma factor RpoH [Bradyrhizobium sp. NBAIM20]MCA1461720.1 RNA polymerase sigma factor RpoH [Bradyrhizobium sp. NBAIM18]
MQTSHEVVCRDPVAVPIAAVSTPFLAAYSAAIRRYELLQSGQEQQLARRWQETRDRRAADALVTSHLRLAAKLARGYRGYGLPLVDLIAEANLGLVIAASRFEPGHGARFSSYAIWWIKATIHDYILRSWSLVKIGTTAAQKKLFFKLRGEIRKATSSALAGLTPDVAELIAGKLEVTAREVIEMDARLRRDMSLNARVGDEDGGAELEALLVDGAVDAETMLADHDQTEQRSRALRAALDGLAPRERHIFEARRLKECPVTRDQLARELSISSERVRQIEIRTFAKVKRAVVNAAHDVSHVAACSD